MCNGGLLNALEPHPTSQLIHTGPPPVHTGTCLAHENNSLKLEIEFMM